jgi:predicted nucleic-acid-binding Zn-ribbon protein
LIKTCHNCGYIRKPIDKNSNEECPKCGAYYAKSNAEKLPVATTPDEKKQMPEVEEKFTIWSALLLEIKNWCVGRFWFIRIPVLLYFSYILVRKLYDWQSYTIFDGINLGIHEMGHPMFSAFGRWLSVAGGTILQCIAPLASMIVLGKQRDYFGITFCLAWLATNLIGISVYMSDATDLELNLVTIGGGGPPVPKEEMHDWHILFDSMGLLLYDKQIGSFVYWLGILTLLSSIIIGAVLVYWMYSLKKEKPQVG